jgi:hypothetical protein
MTKTAPWKLVFYIWEVPGFKFDPQIGYPEVCGFPQPFSPWTTGIIYLNRSRPLPQQDTSGLHISSCLYYIMRVGRSGFDSRRGAGNFPFDTVSRPALGPTQPPVQWVPEDLSPWVKWPGREADHSPPSTAEVKECTELYLHSPILHGAVLS